MTDQSGSPHVSRRAFVTTGSGLLAGFGLGFAAPASATPSSPAQPGELALYRPVSVS
ncbi:hypothetical protein JHN45_03105, partial [Streptomyces sp. MBT53]|nr:hypothetical protein [Streptomyces sp. MBT53]